MSKKTQKGFPFEFFCEKMAVVKTAIYVIDYGKKQNSIDNIIIISQSSVVCQTKWIE